MLVVFLKVLMIFGIVAVGYAANKLGILPIEANPHMINLLLYISIPALIIQSMTENSLTPELRRASLEVLLGTFLWFLVMWVLGLLVVKLLRYEPREDRGVLVALVGSQNTGFMGFPVTQAIFGSQALYFMVLSNCVLGIYMYFLQIFQLNYGSKTKINVKAALLSACNMCMIATAIGLVLLFADVKFPSMIEDFLGILAQATVPVSMIVLGVQLANSDIKAGLTNKKLIVVCLVNVILVPVVTFLICNWLPLTNWAKLTLVFAASFPGAVISVAMTARERKNVNLMAHGVALTTLMSLGTLPVAAMILMKLYM